MSNNVEFVVESTPVLSRAEEVVSEDQEMELDPLLNNDLHDDDNEDDEFDFGFGLDEADTSVDSFDNEKTEVLTELDNDSDLSPFFIDTEGNKAKIHRFPFTVGRGQDCDMVLAGRGISRAHAEVIFESGRFVIKDLDSLNGIRVNGYKVSRVILEDEDEVKIGDVVLTFGFAQKETKKETKKAKNTFTDRIKSRTSEPAKENKGEATKFAKPEFDYDFTKLIRPMAFALTFLVVMLGGVYGYKMYSQKSRVAVVAVPNQEQTQPIQGAVSQTTTPEVAATADSAANSAQSTAADAPTSSIPKSPSVAVNSIPLAGKIDSGFGQGLPEQSFSKPAVKKPVAKAASSNGTAKANQKARVLLGKSDAQYLSGRTADHIASLKSVLSGGKLSGSMKGKVQADLNRLSELDAQYKKGKNAITSRDKTEAAKAWQAFVALEGENQFQAKSVQRREAERWLSQFYLDKANMAKSQGQNHEAYRLWQKSISLDQRADARVALANVDAQAKRLYRKALRLEYVNSEQARKHWQDVLRIVPETNEYYVKSQEKLAWYDEWSP